jgi:hypothetical protein
MHNPRGGGWQRLESQESCGCQVSDHDVDLLLCVVCVTFWRARRAVAVRSVITRLTCYFVLFVLLFEEPGELWLSGRV